MNRPPGSLPRSLLCLVFILTALLASPAAGFETLGMSWPTGRINYKVNPNFPDQELSGTRLQQVDLITCSADSWREQTELDLRFVYLGTTDAVGFNDQDGVNTVSWVDQDVGDALAITIVSGIRDRIIGFDMGGTSTDVSRFDGRYERRYEMEVNDPESDTGVRVVAPMLAIETVAAGGGSICWFDGQKPVVGPRSAGASPGPACYGRGGPLTVTDINQYLC